MNRVAARHQQGDQRVPRLVVSGSLAIGRIEQNVAGRSEGDLLDRLAEIL
jgi:hypothetical protein